MDQPQIVPHHPSERGDELDFIGLWKALVEYKLLIIVFTTLTTLGAIYYASILPTVYRVEVLTLPSSGSGSGSSSSSKLSGLASMAGISLGVSKAGVEGEQAIARLKTRSFLTKFIEEKNIKPILFADQWNEKEGQWTNQEPTNREASEFLLDMMTVDVDYRNASGVVTFILRWEDPISPSKIADIANDLVSSINFKEKQLSILEARKSILFLEKELEHTSILNSQTILYSMIEQQMQKIMFANIRDEFVFKVIDPAAIPKEPETKPTIAIILIGLLLGVFIGFLIAITKYKFIDRR